MPDLDSENTSLYFYIVFVSCTFQDLYNGLEHPTGME